MVEQWTANLAARVRSPVGEEPSVLMCAFLHVQMESNWAGLSVCNCRHTIKAVGKYTCRHHYPLSPDAVMVGEGTSGKVLNWTVRSLYHIKNQINKVLYPTLHICRHGSVGKAIGLYSKGCWFAPTVRHYFSSNNVRLLAYTSSLQVKIQNQND